METDRRSTRRFALSLPVETCRESPFKSQPVTGKTLNVSTEGIYFFCDEICRAGQLLRVRIELSGDTLGRPDTILLAMRYRVQRVEELFQNGSKIFGIATALDD